MRTLLAVITWLGVLIPAASAQNAYASQEGSVCYGSPSNGALEGAVRLPESGENFEVYRWRGGKDRLFVHSQVASILVDAYAELLSTAPGARFLVGETGLENGGPFPPHKTHQSGTSVDLFMPVRELPAQESILFPNDHRNGYGYKVRFDQYGKSLDGRLQVDFEVLAEYIYQLQAAAKRMGRGIDRVIIVQEFQLRLRETKRWSELRWLRYFDDPNDRHDNHVHIDFDIPCKFL